MCQSWAIGLDSLYCGKWRKISKSRHDLDLDRTIPNVELVRANSKYYNMFKFKVDWAIIFWVIVYTDTHTHTQKDTQTPRHADTQTDMSTLQLRLINRNYNNNEKHILNFSFCGSISLKYRTIIWFYYKTG